MCECSSVGSSAILFQSPCLHATIIAPDVVARCDTRSTVRVSSLDTSCSLLVRRRCSFVAPTNRTRTAAREGSVLPLADVHPIAPLCGQWHRSVCPTSILCRPRGRDQEQPPTQRPTQVDA